MGSPPLHSTVPLCFIPFHSCALFCPLSISRSDLPFQCSAPSVSPFHSIPLLFHSFSPPFHFLPFPLSLPFHSVPLLFHSLSLHCSIHSIPFLHFTVPIHSTVPYPSFPSNFTLLFPSIPFQCSIPFRSILLFPSIPSLRLCPGICISLSRLYVPLSRLSQIPLFDVFHTFLVCCSPVVAFVNKLPE